MPETRSFPRLLVVTEFPPNASGGGPAVVRQKLSRWPVEAIHWWSCMPDRDMRFGRAVASHHVATIPAKLYPHFRLRRCKSWLLEQFWSRWAATHLGRTIRELQPEVVWIVPHGWSIPPVFAALKNSRLRYHVSVHDYADVGDNILRFGAGRCARMAAMTNALYTAATTRDAISAPMARDLRERTGKPADAIIRFGVDVQQLVRLQEEAPVPSPPEIRIAYAGSIQVEKEFAFFVDALRQIRHDLPRPLELHLFSAHSFAGRFWFDDSWMRERGNLPEAELAAELRRCDWGFSPMSLTDHDPQYNRFSFPTKFIAYLAAGLPVISLGHPESALMQLAGVRQAGLSFTGRHRGDFAERLREVLISASPRRQFASQILQCAREEFDEDRMQESLRKCFERCAGRSS